MRATPSMFEEISITFKPSTFTKPARMAALDRIGHHVRTVSFNMLHTPETFLPPLVDPMTGAEQAFVYSPQAHRPSTLIGQVKEPKYGSWEMTDLLIKQYPPLFHAATNIPSFIHAFSLLPCLAHFKVSCPGQDDCQRYRRSAIDYALRSLRIAVETAPLEVLDTISLLPIHPGALLYLQPLLGFGNSPRASRRWAQIRRLIIQMDGFPFEQSNRSEHLKILHSYLGYFSPHLTRLRFRWEGDKGPSPFTLDQEPCLQPSDSPSEKPGLRPLNFARLRYMELENATMDSTQVSAFISRHRRAFSEFNFEDVTLRTGTWGDALAPLSRIAGNDSRKQKQQQVMDVPVVLSPANLEPRVMESILQDQQRAECSGTQLAMSRWLSKGRSAVAANKGKELFWSSGEHMKEFLMTSVFPWR
ncbi:hypothetical protein W97_08949 [Coniosporium apollinis CBS 100218]|uniref:Uncharacterized protein n=1 Tax=Coniosporium apollinis (strain CBS 100218) TaxID=1168221 RepID=R7Z6Q6_CONA1|nr:uncharacterized protein W97_08949 [Coniosporium apollinis CBS 100218]EON69689.1 hypothetical protein W97_08949 [Coniosporium apollinis CBS 100218]